MRAFAAALRWDVVLQARNGFYWASAFVMLLMGGLLLALSAAARANEAVWVPAILAVNLPITTFFFMAGLMLLERDEGTLTALAVSPLTPGGYLAARTVTSTALAAVETMVLVLIAFDASRSWLLVLSGTSALGVIYTGIGAGVATGPQRRESVARRGVLCAQTTSVRGRRDPDVLADARVLVRRGRWDYLAAVVIGAASGSLALMLAAFMFERRLVGRG